MDVEEGWPAGEVGPTHCSWTGKASSLELELFQGSSLPDSLSAGHGHVGVIVRVIDHEDPDDDSSESNSDDDI